MTEESAAHGDFEDVGIIDWPTGKHVSARRHSVTSLRRARGAPVDSVEAAVSFIRDQTGENFPEATEYGWSSGRADRIVYQGDWWTYTRTGKEERRAYRPEGFSLSELRRIHDELARRPR